MPLELRFRGFASEVDRLLAAWSQARIAERLWRADPTLWSGNATAIAHRLGWLRLPQATPGRLGAWQRWRDRFQARGLEQVLLLGMGGSSLAAWCVARAYGLERFTLLDTTHPDAVQRTLSTLDPTRTVVVVASKSGTTVETLSLYEVVRGWLARAGLESTERTVAITDRGTPLAERAEVERWAALALAPEDVGGRYSALSVFGLLPPTLAGADVEPLLVEAAAAAERCREQRELHRHPGFVLGAWAGAVAVSAGALGVGATAPWQGFPAWLEQLLAESLGKFGRGLLPVPEPLAAWRLPTAVLAPEAPSGEAWLQVWGEGPEALGGAFFVWEWATAVVGMLLEVNPFDEPDVRAAKERARMALRGELPAVPDALVLGEDPAAELSERFRRLPSEVRYVAIQAFVPPSPAVSEALTALRAAVARRSGRVVTWAYGPRYLHSTGQFHKGGPPTGYFLQLWQPPEEDVVVPGRGYTLGRLIAGQADGDLWALHERGRPVVRWTLPPGEAGLAVLQEAVARI